jgi:hypothetical protein
MSLFSGYRDLYPIITDYLVSNVVKIYLKLIYIFQAYKKRGFGLNNVERNIANISLNYNGSIELLCRTITKYNADLATAILI